MADRAISTLAVRPALVIEYIDHRRLRRLTAFSDVRAAITPDLA